MVIYSTKEFKEVQDKALILRNLLLDKPRRELIIEYCRELNYTTNIRSDLPIIRSTDKKKQVFIQERNDKLFVTGSVPVFNSKLDIIRYDPIYENLTEKLNIFSLYKYTKANFVSNTVDKIREFLKDKDIKDVFGIQYFYSELKPYVL